MTDKTLPVETVLLHNFQKIIEEVYSKHNIRIELITVYWDNSYTIGTRPTPRLELLLSSQA